MTTKLKSCSVIMTVKAILKLVKVLHVYSHNHKRDTPVSNTLQIRTVKMKLSLSIQMLGTTEDTEITIKEYK